MVSMLEIKWYLNKRKALPKLKENKLWGFLEEFF